MVTGEGAIQNINNVLQLLVLLMNEAVASNRHHVTVSHSDLTAMHKRLVGARAQLREVLNYLDAMPMTGRDHIGFRLLKAKIL